VITDDVENHPDNWTSRADAVYDVKGIHVTITKNYQSTKTFVARPYDPIAQSFKLPSQFENGAFVTDVDVYFQAKPEIEQAPVQLEIRTCDETGRPSSTEIVPGTEVIKYPDDVAIDETRARTATKFTFKQPVYLMADKNYALVLKSDTKNYRVWIATLGQPDVLYTNSSYTTQATLGSFFKSQDGTLWTEDQFSDLKFRINRAVFSTNPATVHFVNKEVDNVVLPTNPLQFKHSSNVIRVSHPNHGFTSGDTTRLFSEYWAGQYALDSNARIYGIPVGEIFGSYTSSETTEYNSAEDTVATDRLIISRADLDSYDITVSSVADLGAAAVTGVTAVAAGGDDIFGHTNIHYQIINPNASIMSFQPTNMSLTAKMLRGFTYDGAAPNIPYNYITKTLEFNTNNLLDTSCIVLSDVNELDRVNTAVAITAGGVSDIWTDSFVGVLTMSTTTNHVSPALDITSFHMDLMQHRIDNPTAAGRLITPLPAIGSLNDSLLVSLIADADTTIAFDGANNAIKTTTVGLFDNIVPGKYLNVDGSSESGNNFTTTPLLVTNVSEDLTTVYVSASLTSVAAGDAITIYQYENFTEEATTTDATGESKFITRKINLENPATQIKLLLEANVPSAADFDIYYKTGSVGTNFDNLVWKKFVAPRQTAVGATSSYVSIVKSDVRNNFTDIEFNISDFDSVDNSIDMVAFTAFQIKIVMRSSNAARIPVFRNLRAIAHA
jgi:hypothetical protein